MEIYYSNEKNVQILLALMKAHNVKKIVISPGATNVCFVTSVQNDDYFELYSSVDERSAAYIACGLAEDSGEPVALSCTGATASRNYVSGLTEAYYRKLPILAITSTQPEGRIGHNVPQVVDRTNLLNDIARISVHIPIIHDDEDEWSASVKMNQALLELRHNGGGPAHINLTTTYSKDYSCKELPEVQVIDRICNADSIPELKAKKVGILVGAHSKWSKRLSNAVEEFCEKYNAVVICDHTSNYTGKYGVLATLVTGQDKYYAKCRNMDVLIHMGNISGAYIFVYPEQIWRVNPDGAVCDTYKKLRYTFEMNEEVFFEQYNSLRKENAGNTYSEEWHNEYNNLLHNMPELPFSNAWIAQNTINKLPKQSVLHLGILNSLRTWNFFEADKSVLCYSNTGGFGIDGCMSTVIGAALANPEKLYFLTLGDLAFFYDMNSLGNKHVGNNVRILMINNGKGTEFRNYNHNAAQLGDAADVYVAAAGHYGKKSNTLVKNFVENLGFKYLSASNKDEYAQIVEEFVSNKIGNQPIVLEVFTNAEDESEALRRINNIGENETLAVKGLAKKILGEKNIKTLKSVIRK